MKKIKIGLIAPADSFPKKKFYTAKTNLQKYLPEAKIIIPKNIFKCYGLFAGITYERIKDVNYIINKQPDLVMAIKGGYGSARLLDDIDYKKIKKNKIKFIGYSDFTAILLAINQISKIPTFYGYMLISDFYQKVYKRQIELLKTILSEKELHYCLPAKIIKRGTGLTELNGKSIAGCLSLISASAGTKFFKQYETDNIMFIEDWNEEPYRIDRMLTHLKNAGVFSKTKCLFIDFKGCKPSFKNRGALSVNQTLLDLFKDTGFPIINFPYFGHRQNRIIIPIGVDTEIYIKGSVCNILFTKVRLSG
ncbi:MAG: LD-carboxypeptidase [Candidatus Hydrogenedentota bacterium]